MIREVNDANLEDVRDFLAAHIETSMFLLGNLAAHGPALGPHLHSGNYRAIYEGGRVVAVFCLVRRGNLLVQAGDRAELASTILAACKPEPIEIRGVAGEWNAANAIWKLLCADPGFEPGLTQREVLYGRGLPYAMNAGSTLEVRALGLEDFEAWNVLNVAYAAEVQTPLQGSRDERRAMFGEQTDAGHWWGYFEGPDLVGTASLNAHYERIGQIGGVYTRPGYRGRGLAAVTLQKLMLDAFDRHRLERLILFTAESNAAARRLYESLGFQRLGCFGLLFAR